MRERIITQSIESLRREGLKFSVDTVAERLNISKKTIYKFFSNKEALAVAIYERYYSDICSQAEELAGDKSESACHKLLCLYLDAKSMTSRDIFNKYKLNEAIRNYTAKQNDKLFNAVYLALCRNLQCDETALRIIIDGAFEKLCAEKLSAEEVINFFVKTLL